MKKCARCKQLKSESVFPENSRYTDGLASWCKRCNADASREREKPKRERVHSYLVERKSVPCADCGGKFPHWNMQFDHVRGEKMFAVSEAVYRLCRGDWGGRRRRPSARRSLSARLFAGVVTVHGLIAGSKTAERKILQRDFKQLAIGTW